MTDVALTAFLQWLDLIGVFFNAMVGAVIARNARLDPLGFGVLAVMSGLGGGLIRDTLLQAGPPSRSWTGATSPPPSQVPPS